MSIGENFFIFLKIKYYFFKQQIKAFCKYYYNPLFAICDLGLIFFYLLRNPYVISRKFLQKQKAGNIHTYGETPYDTLEKIAKSFEITEKDTVIELGAGRGKTLFWLSHFIGCKTIGIEWINTFVKRASLLAKFFGKNKIIFHHADMFKIDLQNNAFIYLYGTCMKKGEIQNLIQKFASYSNLKIITISFPLCEYCNLYFIQKELMVNFPWGTTTAYLNRRKKDSIL